MLSRTGHEAASRAIHSAGGHSAEANGRRGRLGGVPSARAQVARWEDKRRRYEILSEVYSDNPFQKWADLTHDQWLAQCREIEERNHKGHLMLGLTLFTPQAGRGRAAERLRALGSSASGPTPAPGGPASLGHPRSERVG